MAARSGLFIQTWPCLAIEIISSQEAGCKAESVLGWWHWTGVVHHFRMLCTTEAMEPPTGGKSLPLSDNHLFCLRTIKLLEFLLSSFNLMKRGFQSPICACG
jgi:hypothetical protein